MAQGQPSAKTFLQRRSVARSSFSEARSAGSMLRKDVLDVGFGQVFGLLTTDPTS